MYFTTKFYVLAVSLQVDKKVVKTECGVLLKIKHKNVVGYNAYNNKAFHNNAEMCWLRVKVIYQILWPNCSLSICALIFTSLLRRSSLHTQYLIICL